MYGAWLTVRTAVIWVRRAWSVATASSIDTDSARSMIWKDGDAEMIVATAFKSLVVEVVRPQASPAAALGVGAVALEPTNFGWAVFDPDAVFDPKAVFDPDALFGPHAVSATSRAAKVMGRFMGLLDAMAGRLMRG